MGSSSDRMIGSVGWKTSKTRATGRKRAGKGNMQSDSQANMPANTPFTTSALWQNLTRVHPSITDIEQRRQSNLHAKIQLALAIVVPLVTLALWVLSSQRGALTM